MPDDPNTGDVTGTPPPWAQGLRAEPVVPWPSHPPIDHFRARCVALEAAARIHQRGAEHPAASTWVVLQDAEKFFEWLKGREPDDG